MITSIIIKNRKSGTMIPTERSHVPIRLDLTFTSAIFTRPVAGVMVRPNLAGSCGSKQDDDAPVSAKP